MPVFGKYIESDSILNRLDPRAKLISIIVLLITAGFIKSLYEFLLFAGIILLAFLITKSIFSLILKGIYSFKWLILLTFLLPTLFLDGKTLLYIERINLYISYEGFNSGIVNSGKLLIFISFSSILMNTTSPLDLTDAITSFIRPLKVFKFPVDNFALMIGISIKFIPIIFGEGQRIRNAQLLRGGELPKNIFKRAVNTISIIIPLIISVFKKGEEMAYSLEARCYGLLPERSRYVKMKFKKNDWIEIIFVILFVISVIYV